MSGSLRQFVVFLHGYITIEAETEAEAVREALRLSADNTWDMFGVDFVDDQGEVEE